MSGRLPRVHYSDDRDCGPTAPLQRIPPAAHRDGDCGWPPGWMVVELPAGEPRCEMRQMAFGGAELYAKA